MELKRKLITHFLLILLTASIILVLTALTISPLSLAITHAIFKVPFGTSYIFDFLSFVIPITFTFVLICLYYGKKVSEVLFYFLEWIELLSDENYEKPKFKTKKGKTLRFFYVYKELEEKLKRLTNKLAENKIERQKIDQMRREWTSGVTHDLKTPLSYIQGYSTMLLAQKQKYSEEEIDESISIILEKSIHMKELLDDLGETFQFETGEIRFSPKSSNIVKFMRGIIQEVKKQPNALEYKFTFQSHYDELNYLFDEVLLQRALNNLLINAINHNPPNTVISTHIFTDSAQENLIIEIQDTGVGMTKEEKDQLFNRYYRGTSTVTPKEGTGLGMAIAKQFINIHQGKISVESVPSQGTTIKIQFPLKN
jgi:signal transduction histidine kinase